MKEKSPGVMNSILRNISLKKGQSVEDLYNKLQPQHMPMDPQKMRQNLEDSTIPSGRVSASPSDWRERVRQEKTQRRGSPLSTRHKG